MAARADLVLPWGDARIPLSVARDDRATLRIDVTPAGDVRVRAPHKATDAEILARVQRRGGWIAAQIKDFDRWRPRTPARQYLTGETHLYLGAQYRLRVEQSARSAARLVGDRILLRLSEADSLPHRRALLEHWYSLQAHRELPQRLDAVLPPFARRGVDRPKLIIRRMTKRWGSYTAKGNLVLNLDVIRAPLHCIDYVIAHELAHALEPDHGACWRALMDLVTPDWQERKSELEQRLL